MTAMLDEELRRVAEPLLAGSPSALKESILYSFLGPGKRIRPRLVLAVARALRIDLEVALRLGAALEMTHAYTLIHDDLPAMDNDDFRRGRPTNHKVYGEATALLAGDSLALLACDAILSIPGIEPARKLGALRVLLEASGARGVIAGQASESALRIGGRREALAETFRLKTGALFRAALVLPVACDPSLSPDDSASLSSKVAALGEAIGVAFQIADDLEDDFAARRDDPAHVAHYLGTEEATEWARRELEDASGKFANLDPSSPEFRIREELHPFLEELEAKLTRP